MKSVRESIIVRYANPPICNKYRNLKVGRNRKNSFSQHLHYNHTVMVHLHIFGAARSLFLMVDHIDEATLYLLCLVSFLWLGRHKQADGWMLQEMTVLCC